MAGIDWFCTFQNVALGLLAGDNPHLDIGYFNPTWAIFPLLPFALLGDSGYYLFALCGALIFGIVAYKFGASHFGMLLVLLSPFALTSLAMGNVESLALLGLLMPAPMAIVMLAIKPQLTICVILFLLIREARKGKRKLLIALAPVVVLSIITIALYGFYPLRWIQYSGWVPVNASVFPWGLPLGVMLFWQSVRANNLLCALAASPFFFPAVTPAVYVVEMIALSSGSIPLLISNVSLWGLFLTKPT